MINDKTLFKQIDKAESRLINNYEKWLNETVKTIPWREYDRLQKVGGIKALAQAPFPVTINTSALAKILTNHAVEMLGAGKAHAKLLTTNLHRQYKKQKLAYPGFDFDYTDDNRVIPLKAISAMEKRSIYLSGDIDGSLLAEVKKIMTRFLAGASRIESEADLQEVLTSNFKRAQMIATTETTYSYNRGRLIGYKESLVDYVSFSAIMDSRTSPICSSRHGLLMRLDDPELDYNTPPLHGRCRSVLNPVYSAYQPDLIIENNLDWKRTAPLPSGWNVK